MAFYSSSISAFRRTLGSSVLGFEELRTLLCHIGAVINARPLLTLSEDPADHDVQAPAHFLTGGPSSSFIEPDVSKLYFNRLDSWQRVFPAAIFLGPMEKGELRVAYLWPCHSSQRCGAGQGREPTPDEVTASENYWADPWSGWSGSSGDDKNLIWNHKASSAFCPLRTKLEARPNLGDNVGSGSSRHLAYK